MPFCSACGIQNSDTSRFCISCGQPMTAPIPPAPLPQTTPGNSGFRTATMVICLIAAILLFFGGIAGCTTGGVFEGIEEVFESELDDPDQGVTSTTEDVFGAGALAIVTSIALFLGAGLARVATKTSLLLLIVSMMMLIRVVVLDTTSVFAVAYYLSTLMTGVGVILMSLAYWRGRRRHTP